MSICANQRYRHRPEMRAVAYLTLQVGRQFVVGVGSGFVDRLETILGLAVTPV
jgi:hypothetical protein